MRLDKEKPLITIQRTGCLGECPVYSAEIYLDGTVLYKGEHFVKVVGESRYRMSLSKVNELVKAFEKADYFSLNSLYRAEVTCQPSTITSIDLDGRRKRIENESAGPKKLELLENKIDMIAGLGDLIGTRR